MLLLTSQRFLLQKSVHSVLKSFVCCASECPKVRSLKEVINEKIPCSMERIQAFRKKHNNTKIGDITVGSVYGGMRGMIGLICETSDVCPDKGVRFRGRTIEDCQNLLPRACEDGQPLPESLFWLLCTGDIPTADEASQLSMEWQERGKLNDDIVEMINKFPKTLHPMAQLSCAVCALSQDSCFAKAYTEGLKKDQYWTMVYEDAMNLIAKLPAICASIYVHTYKDGKADINLCPELDWTGNFVKMMGFDDPGFAEMMRLYLVLHSDHEGGNVSAHAVNLVGSALADPYLAYAAGMNGLAGPLHGLANQEVLLWIKKMQDEIGEGSDDSKIKEYIEKTIKSGKVVPGYGHAVLRSTDPRYTAFSEFAKKNKPDDKLVQLVQKLFTIVPPILKATGKIKNPMPNVDGSSGALLTAYGLTEMNYYTVLFALSRALGTMAQLIWARVLMLPIERPKSVPTKALIEMLEKKSDKKDDKKDEKKEVKKDEKKAEKKADKKADKKDEKKVEKKDEKKPDKKDPEPKKQ